MATPKVLIVDDNPVVLLIISDMVRELGYTPIPVATAEAALDRLYTEDIDILLCDISLGRGLSGVELVVDERISMPKTVVLMSGNPKPNNLPGNVRYLSKPFTMIALDLALRT